LLALAPGRFPESSGGYLKVTDDEKSRLLEVAADKQKEFWDALSELESALDIAIQGTQDLSGLSVEDLIEIMERED
jgi:hypothetical protein